MRYYTPTRLSDNIRETPEGFLLCLDVPLTRTGAFVYGANETPLEADADGQITMWRSDEEVFSADTIASFEGKPITIDHPEGFVGPDNWKDLAVGIVQNVRRGSGGDSDKLLGDLLITDAQAILLVKNGLREVSCGYEAEYTQVAAGEGKQSDIIGNHVALVERGRAGPTCAIHDNEEGKVTLMKNLKDFKTKMVKLVDEAMGGEDPSKKEETKAGDAEGTVTPEQFAAVVERLDKLESIIANLKTGDEDPEKKGEGEDPENKTGDEGEGDIVSRLTAIEEVLKKLAAAESAETEGKVGDEGSVPDPKVISGDSAARAEILVPGKKLKSNAEVMNAFASTTEGAAVLKALTGDKAPAEFKDGAETDRLLVASSEIVKAKRGAALAATKTIDSMNTIAAGPMTPEMVNDKNAAFYGKK